MVYVKSEKDEYYKILDKGIKKKVSEEEYLLNTINMKGGNIISKLDNMLFSFIKKNIKTVYNKDNYLYSFLDFNNTSSNQTDETIELFKNRITRNDIYYIDEKYYICIDVSSDQNDKHFLNNLKSMIKTPF